MFGLVSQAVSSKRPTVAQFTVAVAAVLCAAAVWAVVSPLLGGHSPLLLFTLSVMIAARHGGLLAGLLATGLSGAVGLRYFAFPPDRLPNTLAADIAFLALFATAGIAISVVNDKLRRALAVSAAEAEQRRIVTENVPQLLWTCTPQGKCDYLSGRWAEYTGIAVDDQLEFGWVEQVHPDDRARVLSEWNEAVQADADFRIEFRIRRSDGVYRWFDTRAIAVRDGEGKVLKWFGSNTDIHEATVAREELNTQQERLTKIVATAPGVICSFRLRPDGTACFPYASPGVEDIYDVKPEDLVNDSSPVFDRICPDDVSAVQDSIALSAESMQPWRAEFRVIHPVKGEIWVEGHSQPAQCPDGSIEWYGFIRDITARRQIEEKLRERTAALEELTRTLDLAHVIVRGLDGRITYWSRGAGALYGWNSAEAVGRVSHQLLRTEFPEPLEEVEAELFKTGSWAGELRHFRRDGAAVDVASHWALHRDASGRPRSIIEVNNDISEQKRVERELRASEERLELAQAAAGIVAWDWDIEGERTVCSEGYGALYGLPPARYAPSTAEWLELIHPDDRQGVQRALDLALGGEMPYDAEFRIVLPDGSTRWLMGRGRAHRNRAGKAVRMVGVNLDVTERKALAEQLRALSASLISAQEEERRRISRELHDDLVQRLGLMAIDLGRLNSRFGGLGPRLTEELRAVQERVSEAAELTRHIAHELHPWILDDLGIVTALGSLCSEVGRREELDVTFASAELPRRLPREIVSCLYAVAQESLQNIVKHAKAKHVLTHLTASADTIRMEIIDDGVGCHPQAVAGGMGLGIVNMRERVRWAKGNFHLESQPGLGSRVVVELPRREHEEAASSTGG